MGRIHRWLRRSSAEAGELDHVDVARSAGRIHKQVSPIDYIFSEKREMLVRMVEFDEEWSGPWIAAHPCPEPPSAQAD